MNPLLLPKKIIVLVLCVLVFVPGGISQAATSELQYNPKDWYVSVYGSQWIGGEGSTSLSGVFAYRNLQNSYLYTVSVGKELGRPFQSYDSLYLDVEGQVGIHTGEQDHSEYTGALIARWEDFPWDQELDTSFAIGEGISWASEVPEREKKGSQGSAHLLNYLVFDVSVSPWKKKQWEGFFRVHHRSGIFGTFSGVHGASNFIGFGIRMRK